MDIEKLLREMSVFEKIMQCTQLISNFYRGTKLEDNTANAIGPYTQLGLKQSDIYLAGTVNFLSDETGAMLPSSELRRIQKECIEKSPHHIPTMFVQDVIHGYLTIYPIPLAMAASFNPSLMERCAAMAAKEASANGVDMALGPMVDLARDARWGRVTEGVGKCCRIKVYLVDGTPSKVFEWCERQRLLHRVEDSRTVGLELREPCSIGRVREFALIVKQ